MRNIGNFASWKGHFSHVVQGAYLQLFHKVLNCDYSCIAIFNIVKKLWTYTIVIAVAIQFINFKDSINHDIVITIAIAVSEYYWLDWFFFLWSFPCEQNALIMCNINYFCTIGIDAWLNLVLLFVIDWYSKERHWWFTWVVTDPKNPTEKV